MLEYIINGHKIYYKSYSIKLPDKDYYIKILEDIKRVTKKTSFIVLKDNFKKPFLYDITENILYPFSISHSKDRVVVVFSLDKNISLGVDIELKKVSSKVIDRITTKQEKDYILKNNLDNNFVWQSKEAISKAIGSGLSMKLSNINLANFNRQDLSFCLKKIEEKEFCVIIALIKK